MGWPSDQDYNEAVQNPRVAFADHELQSGQIELNAMGIPKARSGNFATVYKINVNGTSHAIRCFRYDNPEYHTRYPEIASCLAQNTLPYMVSFRYMSHGVRVGSSRYPIVRMRWVEGESLVSYVERNLSSPTTLRDLAVKWTEMLSDLRQAKISHGDLQHGNVLVAQGKLRLVDYDGMYVPGLEGRRGIELGHRNYQHPQRTELDFGVNLDNFSAWLIYTSLIAVAAQPTLWGKLKAGDECLLFREGDLKDPDRSPVFQALKESPDAQIQFLAEQIESFLWMSPEQVPAISCQETAVRRTFESASSTSSLPSWIQGYANSFSSEATEEFPTIEVGDQSWLQDHIEQSFTVGSFSNKVSTDGYIALCIVFFVFVVCTLVSRAHGVSAAAWIGGIVTASLGTATAWWFRYRAEPVYLTIVALRSDLAMETKKQGDATRIFEDLKTQRLRRRDTFTEEGLNIQRREADMRDEEVRSLRDIDVFLQNELQKIGSRKRALSAEEGGQKRRLDETLGGEISRVSRAIVGLPDQQRQELATLDLDIGAKVVSFALQLQKATARRDKDFSSTLREYQDQIVNGHLQRIRLSGASVPGIGPQLLQRLAMAGFVSAGDIGTRHSSVPGIGQKKWAALYDWRRQLEIPIRAKEAPKFLPPYKVAAIEQRHDTQIQQLQQSLEQEQSRLATARENVKTRMRDRKKALEQKAAMAENELRQRKADIEKKYGDKRKQVVADEQLLRQHHHQSIEETRAQFKVAADQLAHDGDQIKKLYRESLDQLNNQVEEAAKLTRDCSWRLKQAERRYLAHRPVSFWNYSLRVFRLVHDSQGA